MNKTVAQAVALNSYARKGNYLSESWASREFKRTYEVAVEACRPDIDSTMGVSIYWSPERPENITLSRTNIISDRNTFTRELPVDGALGEAFIADLQKLAVAEAAVRIQAERDAALHKEASDRVEALLQTAAAQA